MRTAAVAIVLVAFAGTLSAQPRKTYTSNEGKYSVKFPDDPKVTEKTTNTALGELTVTVATFATSDGSTYMVSFTDFPASATKPENRGTLFDGIRDGVAGKDGKLVSGSERELTFVNEKWPGREFTVEKGGQRIRYRVILKESRVYQIAVIGTTRFVEGKDATAFFDSLELTK